MHKLAHTHTALVTMEIWRRKGQPNKGPFFLSVPQLTVKSLFVFVYSAVAE